jgi:hypothetical protein
MSAVVACLSGMDGWPFLGTEATASGVATKRTLRGRYEMVYRNVLQLMDVGAESPQESRTGLLPMDGGLPRPRTQIVVHNSTGRFVARVDMGWEEWKVGVGFDGAH